MNRNPKPIYKVKEVVRNRSVMPFRHKITNQIQKKIENEIQKQVRSKIQESIGLVYQLERPGRGVGLRSPMYIRYGRMQSPTFLILITLISSIYQNAREKLPAKTQF